MRAIAKVVGVLFMVGALYGFVDAGFGMDSSLLAGIFPVNAVLNLVHLVLGIWGYSASRADGPSGHFCRWAGVIFIALGGVGFAIERPFDLLPLGGADRFLHLGVGVVLLAAGLVDAARPRAYHRSR
jgi:hypothetical protein